MLTAPDINDQVAALHEKRRTAIQSERIARDAAFLHSSRFPLHENIAGFKALPLNLFHCNLLRMINSPFMPPFETPAPVQLANFLWVLNPDFTRENSPAKQLHFKGCRKFMEPRFPFFKNRWTIKCWERQAAAALLEFTKVVIAARQFIEESFNDRSPVVRANGIEDPDYYSDFCSINATLMRAYPGLIYEQIQFLPLKVVYQFLKEIQDHTARMNGQPALLWNSSDRYTDEVLAILNQRI